MTIQGLMALGLIAGLGIGLLFPNQKIGCTVLLAVPLAMIGYIKWWQGQHPENLTSTSALDFVFGPLWPGLGAIAGFYAGKFVRDYFSKR